VIEVVSRQRLIEVDNGRIARLAVQVLDAAGIRRPGRVTVGLVRDPAIRRLNREFRGRDRATDVLSFPNNARKTARRRPPQKAGHLRSVWVIL
jgi:probable rRNA maturation factor